MAPFLGAVVTTADAGFHSATEAAGSVEEMPEALLAVWLEQSLSSAHTCRCLSACHG